MSGHISAEEAAELFWNQGELMTVQMLIDQLIQLDPAKSIITQVVAADNTAWNCWCEVNDIPNTDLVQLRISHPDLKTLPKE